MIREKGRKPWRAGIIPLAAFLALTVAIIFAPQAHTQQLDILIQPPSKEMEDLLATPKERISRKGEVLYCTGESEMAAVNNRGAQLIEEGKYAAAVEAIEKDLEKAPLFFPFRYNLGLAYLFMREYPQGMLQLKKAVMIMPGYPRTYLHIGSIYSVWNQGNLAIDAYREALKCNSGELEAYICIGDIYFNRNQYEIAKKYYEAALGINHRFADGILGLAKINYKKEKYIESLLLLKSIDISGEYDKSYHYYFAECSYKQQDYATAAYHYDMLLKFRNDKFFLTNSPALIKHKLDLSRRFIQ